MAVQVPAPGTAVECSILVQFEEPGDWMDFVDVTSVVAFSPD